MNISGEEAMLGCKHTPMAPRLKDPAWSVKLAAAETQTELLRLVDHRCQIITLRFFQLH